MVRDTVRYKQYCTKSIRKMDMSKNPSSKSFKMVGGTLGRASDDERSKSFKMVRDIVRYKQFGTKNHPKPKL